MFLMVTKVFLFTFSGVFNRQRIHNLFKNQMITNHAIQLNVCNSQCSHGTWTCFHFWNAPMGPGPAFTFAMLPWDLLSLLQCSLETWTLPAPPWLSLFKCVLIRHGERIGYLCHRWANAVESTYFALKTENTGNEMTWFLFLKTHRTVF